MPDRVRAAVVSGPTEALAALPGPGESASLQQLVYAISHDLRASLRTVKGFSQLLSRRYQHALDEEAREFIAFIVDGAGRMEEMINGLLAYSRVATDGGPFRETGLEPVLEGVIAGLKGDLGTLDAVTYDRLPTVVVDADQLAEVFRQLIRNAMKFRSDRPLQVHVSAAQLDDGWALTVSDNGIGIDQQHLVEVFGIFRRLHTPDEYPGVGIGLAICQRIVERHGGRIWMESTPGAGATCRFTIPVVPMRG